MRQYVAFLRAINVGGHVVRMADLRALMESAGLDNVQTYIQSGNVIFDAPVDDESALERAIGTHLRAALGYEVETFVRSMADLTHLVQTFIPAQPEMTSEGIITYVLFVHQSPSAAGWQKLLDVSPQAGKVAFAGREVFWMRPTPQEGAKFDAPPFEKLLGMPGTMRNVSTLRKIVAKYGEAAM